MSDAAPLSAAIKAIMDEYHRAIFCTDEERVARRRARARKASAARAARPARSVDRWRPRRPGTPARGGLVDVVFENPLHGRFKDLPLVTTLLRDYPGRLSRLDTSYCHFEGFEHNKPTVFITTLPGLALPSPCPSNPCATVRAGRVHAAHVAECDAALRNAIPHGITDALVGAWLAKHAARDVKAFLFIDAFAGHGSVHERVRATTRARNVSVYANDIVDYDQEGRFDLGADSPFHLDSLLAMALARRFPEAIGAIAAHAQKAIGWAKAHNVAVLFHLSTPCETYSTQALGVHRVAGSATPVSAAAFAADAMNDKLLEWVERVVLAEDE